MYAIEPTLLKREAKQLMDSCFWANSHYWTTRPPGNRRSRSTTGIKIAYLSKSGWFAFVFSQFHREGIEIFRSLLLCERWFYQEPINKFKSFSAWCCHPKHLDPVLKLIAGLSNIEFEFVVVSPQLKKVPAQFKEMGLEFFEVGQPC